MHYKEQRSRLENGVHRIQTGRMSSSAIQQMDSTSLIAVVKDLRELIIPSRFERAQQPNQGSIQLGFRNLDGLIWLELSWDARAPRLVQINPPERLGSESTLAQQFQYGLNQLALVSIEQKGFERIITFSLAKRPGDPIQKTIILELMGRHSNILLLNSESKIITLGRQVRSHQSRVRPISTGDSYTSPPSLKGLEPSLNISYFEWKERLTTVPKSLKESLQDSYQGISPALAMQICGEEKESADKLSKTSILKISERELKLIYENWKIWLNCLKNETLYLQFTGPTEYRFWSNKETNSKDGIKSCKKLGEYFKIRLEKITIEKLYSKLIQKVTKSIEKENYLIQEQEKLLKESLEMESTKRKADKIMCSIPLNKDLIKEAQNLYNKAKKLKRSKIIIMNRLTIHNKNLERIIESKYFLGIILNSKNENNSKKIANLTELSNEIDELIAPTRLKSKVKIKSKDISQRPLEIKTKRGLKVIIGRNHRQNELISHKEAKPGDLWFHAQECPGSHVILKGSERLPDEEDLQTASDLAAFFSRAKNNTKVPVVIVPIEKLKRIPGSVPGALSYKEAKVCWAYPVKANPYIYPE